MLKNDERHQIAKERTRTSLAGSPQFRNLNFDEQKSIFQKTYDSNYESLGNSLTNGNGLPGAFAAPTATPPNKNDYKNDRIDQAGQLVGDFVREVNFPKFVKDLVEGVFQANLAVQTSQTEVFIKLMKESTKSIASYINNIDKAASFAYLAENNSDEFSFGESDELDESGNKQPVLMDKEGNTLDPDSDNRLKAKIMDAKIQMAKEQRAMLREVLLMGVTRMVVEKGNIKASVLFDFKAEEQMKRQDKSANKNSTTGGGSASIAPPLFGLFGGLNLGGGASTRNTSISISSAKGQTSSSLAAKLAGSVDLTFKTDYFKLDNFAQMYGPTTGEERLAASAPPSLPKK
jgi:hypothetical protein